MLGIKHPCSYVYRQVHLFAYSVVKGESPLLFLPFISSPVQGASTVTPASVSFQVILNPV